MINKIVPQQNINATHHLDPRSVQVCAEIHSSLPPDTQIAITLLTILCDKLCRNGRHLLSVFHKWLLICDQTCGRAEMLLEDPIKDIFGMSLGIVEVNPILAWHSDTGRILFDLGPICLVPHVSGRFAGLLNGLDALVSAIES